MNGLKCEPTKASLKRARHWAKLMKQLEEPQVGDLAKKLDSFLGKERNHVEK